MLLDKVRLKDILSDETVGLLLKDIPESPSHLRALLQKRCPDEYAQIKQHMALSSTCAEKVDFFLSTDSYGGDVDDKQEGRRLAAQTILFLLLNASELDRQDYAMQADFQLALYEEHPIILNNAEPNNEWNSKVYRKHVYSVESAYWNKFYKSHAHLWGSSSKIGVHYDRECHRDNGYWQMASLQGMRLPSYKGDIIKRIIDWSRFGSVLLRPHLDLLVAKTKNYLDGIPTYFYGKHLWEGCLILLQNGEPFESVANRFRACLIRLSKGNSMMIYSLFEPVCFKDDETVALLKMGIKDLFGVAYKREKDCFNVFAGQICDHAAKFMMLAQVRGAEQTEALARHMVILLSEAIKQQKQIDPDSSKEQMLYSIKKQFTTKANERLSAVKDAVLSGVQDVLDGFDESGGDKLKAVADVVFAEVVFPHIPDDEHFYADEMNAL